MKKRRSFANQLLVTIAGTEYHSSQKNHCENCNHRELSNGKINYFHSTLTPVNVLPENESVISLEPELIIPQDGHDKQDCEIQAAKRWIEKYGAFYAKRGITILGDDLFSRQPFCKALKDKRLHFILVCKPDSHIYLYQEVRITREDTGEQLCKNAFVTDFEVKATTVEAIAQDGRARWKVENENNNILKTKGYHIEHTFGHGKQHLTSLLLSLNLLAFLFHTVLDLVDEQYHAIRKTLGTRRRFFGDFEALSRYFQFEN